MRFILRLTAVLHIVASVLTDDSEGETPMIPFSVMEYSSSLEKETDVRLTLETAMNVTRDVSEYANHDTKIDPVVR